MGKCKSCPFNEGLTDEADQAQNYGCLPSAYEIVKLKDGLDINWECHSTEGATCGGLREVRDTSTGTPLTDQDPWTDEMRVVVSTRRERYGLDFVRLDTGA